MAGPNIKTLQIIDIIVHKVPLDREGASVTLSDVVSPADPKAFHFVEEQLRSALSGKGSYEAVLLTNTQSPVPAHVKALLATSNADIVGPSQEMAKHLFKSQRGTVSPGLLVVARCTVKIGATQSNAIAVSKLEEEEGAQIQFETTAQGKQSLNVVHVQNLMITQKTRLFKVALFSVRGSGGMDIRVCDAQRPSEVAMAHFYLNRFLGCDLARKPEIATREFMDAMEAFINEKVENPKWKADYHVALISEMSSAEKTFSPTKFAENHLHGTDRKGLLEYLEEKKISTDAFTKDTKHIENRLKKTRMEFQNGTVVLATLKAMEERAVTVKAMEAGVAEVKVTGKVKNVRGRSR